MATVLSVGMSAQSVDTTSIYKDRKDSLNATVFVGHQENSISRGKTLRTELISASGLQKMACCNLAESFENSASVTVGYSDAVTGARQIRLLGLSGTYTQMLDENRPVMRGDNRSIWTVLCSRAMAGEHPDRERLPVRDQRLGINDRTDQS